ncbi:uncharacterized protein LOC116426132 [Nomia melanderi]|uniref:uncharacterized protein LOC116426132 n=1 Tax=Nomia melanderi TaxID=2448451 RepID=UPI00130439C8|nr:phosphatidylinositol-glycan biosynthesis class X protein [Nomia melanderi]XP_031830522.1 phosphatidylinositol-glycan biosynthesis class X protein [Nomia melanderi]
MTLNNSKHYFVCSNLLIILVSQSMVICERFDAHISLTTKGEGFHRFLIYEINLDVLINDSYIALYLQLPSTLYSSVDELNDLRRLGINTICSAGETNVELFMERAQFQNITICSALSNKKFLFKFPVHLRYQYANDINTYMNIIIPKPKLLLGCKKRIKEYRVSTIDLCSPCVEIINKWREIPYIMDTQNVIWIIPIGNSSLLTAVTCVTLLSTILCTMFLLQTICKSVLITHKKKV